MDYSNLRTATVIPALQKFGRSVTYKKYTGSHSAATGENTRTLSSSADYWAVINDLTGRAVDGTMVKVGDKAITISGIPAPDIGDEVVYGGSTYSVVSWQAIAPAGDAVAYVLQVRP